jgi:ribonuclease HI
VNQLFRRIGNRWHSPQPDEPTLPTPNNPGAKTTLRLLASRVPSDGPRITQYPTLPAGAPDWGGRVEIILKKDNEDYRQVTETVVNDCQTGNTINIFCDGLTSNRNRDDAKQIGAASAVVYHEGKETLHAEQVFGEATTDSDARIRSFNSGLDALADVLTTQNGQGPNQALFLLHSSPTLKRVLDTSPHDQQPDAIGHATRLGEILNTFPNLNIKLLWLPRNCPFVGFKRAKQLALEAIRTADPTTIDEPQTIKCQKANTQRIAIDNWAERWHQAPRTSLAYQTALTKPPDGNPHPTFIHAKAQRSPGGRRRASRDPTQHRTAESRFSRHTTSTLYRIITGHAFTGAYTQRFHPQHTPSQIACQCGEPIQTVEHVLRDCPRYTAARRKHLTANGRLRNLSQMFSHPKRVHSLLRFLEETGACAKPQETWDPG